MGECGVLPEEDDEVESLDGEADDVPVDTDELNPVEPEELGDEEPVEDDEVSDELGAVDEPDLDDLDDEDDIDGDEDLDDEDETPSFTIDSDISVNPGQYASADDGLPSDDEDDDEGAASFRNFFKKK